MKRAHETLVFRELIEVLQGLCAERRTGTLFLHTDSNRSARIGLENGRIFLIVFGKYRGMDALQEMKKMRHGKFNFAESVFNNAAELPLPHTADILAQLSWVALDGDPEALPGSGAAQAPPAIPLPPRDLTPLTPPDGALPDAGDLRVTGEPLCRLVAEKLALSIGPVATLVCEDYRERLLAVRGAEDLKPLVMEIAAEIGGPEAAGRFLARVLKGAGL